MNIHTLAPIGTLQPIQGGGTAGTPGTAPSKVPFADLLSQAMQDVESAQQAAAGDAAGLVLGSGDDLHSIMIRSAMEATAIETAVELTTRVVSAYKEVMQMQV